MGFNQFSKRFLPIATFFFIACNGNTAKNQTLKADTLLSISPDSIKTNESQILEERLNELGGVILASIDKESKCNLTKARYIFNKVVADSNDIAFVVEHIGKKIFNTAVNEKDVNCPYPVMCVVYFYMNKQDLKNQDNVASYSVTPGTGIDVYVNSRKLSEYK